MAKRTLSPAMLPYREWLDAQEKSTATRQKYVRDADKFLRFAGKDPSKITKPDVLTYKESLTAKYKPSSVNAYLISLNNYFSFLKRDDLRARTLLISRKRSLNNVLNADEYNALIRTALNRKEMRLYYLIRLLASSGIRVGELQYITVEMLKSGKVEVVGRKKVREIIIPKKLCGELQQYCREQNITKVVFHGRNPAVMLDKAWIWRKMKQLAQYAGVPQEKVHAQNFRHFFARAYLARYQDLVDLADVLGHTSIETTRIYTRTSRAEKQSRIDAMD
jgi:site-specific recombinase XerD